MQWLSLKYWERIPDWYLLILLMGLLVSCNFPSPVAATNEEAEPPQIAVVNGSGGGTDSGGIVEIVPTAVPSSGRVYFVSLDGVDGNSGSQDAPWRTIQYAVDQVIPGDTISIEAGTYVGARIESSGLREAWITLQAAPGAQVSVNAPGPGNTHESILEFETWEGSETVSFWVIDGLDVSDAPNWGIDIRGAEGNHSHDFIIRNNRVHDNGIDSGKSGIFTAFVDDVIVEGNESYANGEHGLYLSNSGDRFVVRGNQLHHNNNCGLHMNGDWESGEDGIISDGWVENNSIYENGIGGCSGINMDGVMNVIVRNNLLFENHAGGISIFQENGAVCSQNIQILNNTIVQAADGRWAINISDEACINNKIFNNIILTFHEWRGSIVIPATGIPGFESDFNIMMDRFSADDDDSVISLSQWQALGYDVNSRLGTAGNLFVGTEDFHLRVDSPAIDAGQTLPGVGFDLAGVSRPQGAGYDIGAFEFIALQGQSQESDTSAVSVGGTITYTFNGHVYRIAAQEGAVPEDISIALDQLSRGDDGPLNISPDGEWLVLETERFDPECVGWSCLAVVSGDLSFGEVIRANGQVVRVEGASAIASGGNLVVYSYGDGPHEIDLWAVSRNGGGWSAPVLLTAASRYAFNNQLAISDDGSKVVFNCGPGPYGGEGTAICEVGVNGAGFRVVLTPSDAPAGFPKKGALHHPDYASAGVIIFEADWGSEQIWQLLPGVAEPVLVTDRFGNDNSPCVLPDGRIVSLWLDRPGSAGVHEIKIMTAEGSSFFILLPDLDVQDIGLGCGEGS